MKGSLLWLCVYACLSWHGNWWGVKCYFQSIMHPDIRPLELYNQAVNLQRKGEFAAAIENYLQALQYFPEFPEAHQNLGHLYEAQNNAERCRYHHTMSVKHASSDEFNASAIVNIVSYDMRSPLGREPTHLTRLTELLQEAEQLTPNNTNVIYTQALLLEHTGQQQQSMHRLQRVIALDDRHALSYMQIGNYYFRAGNFEVAAKFYRHSIERLPEWDVYNKVLVLNNLGQCYRESGKLKLAYEAFHSGLQCLAGTGTNNDTANTSPNTNTSITTPTTDNTAYKASNTDFDLYYGGKYDGKAVHFWCLNNMYTIQGMLCDWSHVELLERRIEEFLVPPAGYDSSRINNEGGSGAYTRKSASDKPPLAYFKAEGVQLDAYTMSLLKYASRAVDRHVCEQSCTVEPVYTYEDDVGGVGHTDQPSGTTSIFPDTTVLTTTHSSPVTHTTTTAITAHSSPVTHTTTTITTTARRVLRVGYLSHDWRDHPMGRLTATLVTNHHQSDAVLSASCSRSDGNSSGCGASGGGRDSSESSGCSRVQRINATLLSYGANDRSEVRQYVQTHSPHFLELHHLKNDLHVAQLIHGEQFDIVVDLTAHTYNGRIDIVAARPAPVIINYLGFPGTTGCASVDYSMVHSGIVPAEYAQSLFTERMLYLPYTYQSNDMPLRAAPPLCSSVVMTDTCASGADTGDYYTSCCKSGQLVRYANSTNYAVHNTTAGTTTTITTTAAAATAPPNVPKDAILVCSFNANKKMEPTSFRAWMNILGRVPTAVLVMLDVSKDVKKILRAEASYCGIVPARVVFIPKRAWKVHLLRSAECDLVLDTFVYGAHTTASDVLWMGAPLLSLVGFGSQRMPSKVAASITQALSVPSNGAHSGGGSVEPMHILVVDSIQQYEDTAVRLLRRAVSVRTARGVSGVHSGTSVSDMRSASSVSYAHAASSIRALLSKAITHRAVRSAAFDSELMQTTIEFAYQAVHEARQILTQNAFLTTPRMPHIVIPDFETTQEVHKEGLNDYSCVNTWEKKFKRDLQQCCGLYTGVGVHVLFANMHDRVGVSDYFGRCEGGIIDSGSSDGSRGGSSVCAVSEFHALVRRLITAYPVLSHLHPAYTALNYTTSNTAAPVPPTTTSTDTDIDHTNTADTASTANTAIVSGDVEVLPEDDVSNATADANTATYDCASHLDTQCAVQLFTYPELASATCTKPTLYRQVQQCFAVSAPHVYDWVAGVQAILLQNKLCSAELTMYEFLRPIMLLAPHELAQADFSFINAVGVDASALLLKVTSVSTYVSPLWRELSVVELRAVVVQALLPRYAALLVAHVAGATVQDVYLHYLRQYAPRVYTASGYSTVCKEFLITHNVHLPTLQEEYVQCEHVMRMLLARWLTDHSLCSKEVYDVTPHYNTDTTNTSDPGGSTDTSSAITVKQDAVLSLVVAYAADPASQRLLNLGTMLQDVYMTEIGFFVSSVAVLLKAKSLPAPLLPPVLASLALLANSGSGQGYGSRRKPRIVFYCDEYGQGWWPGWGPSSLHTTSDTTAGTTSRTTSGTTVAKGMGGSEEAVYYTSIELAKRGYEVVVFAGVTEADHNTMYYYTADGVVSPHTNTDSDTVQHPTIVGSVRWLHYDHYNLYEETTQCEVFVAWRYVISLGLARQPRYHKHCGRKYLWLHDLIPGHILPPSFFAHFDGILVQSAFHKEFIYDAFEEHARTERIVNLQQVDTQIMILSNGISNMHSMDGANGRSVFVYGSAPGRGLALVLSQWKTIKAAIPHATLEVYYGFTASAVNELRSTYGDKFDEFYAQMQVLLQQDGVKYFGSVDHATLTTAYSRAGYLLYPTTFQETGCITVLRAMACGALPITSRLHPSVLHRLTEGYDLGPHPLTRADAVIPEKLHAWLTTQWTPAVISAYFMDSAEDKMLREKMKADIQKRYSWAETANTFVNIMNT